MTRQQFDKWLKDLKTAWESKNPNAAIDLVAEKFIWYETPFSPAIENKNDLLKEWNGVLNQENIDLKLETLAVTKSYGIVKWWAKFTLISTKKTMIYEGILQAWLDEKSKCTKYIQWFNINDKL